MNNYTWNTKNIEYKLSELRKRTLTDDLYKLDITTFNEMLGKHSNDSHLEFNIEQNKETKNFEPLLLELASEFYKNYLFKACQFPGVNLISFSNDDILDLVHDFYKTCSPKFYDYFLNAFKKKDTNLQIRNNPFKSSAIAYHILSEKESYINLEITNTIYDVINMVHEYAHAITFLMNPNYTTNTNFTFIRELDGLFFQTKFMDYLIENRIFEIEAILAKLEINRQMSKKACFIQADKFNLYNTVFFFSYLASIELCMSKCQFPEEILEKIIKENPHSISDIIETLNSYITLNENAEAFQKKLKKQLDKNLKLG